jgi:hypothetical protein
MSAVPQRAPTILRSIAVAGVLIAIIGTVVVWVFLADLEDTTERSLLIGEQATVTLNETIDVADQVLKAVDDGLSTVQATCSSRRLVWRTPPDRCLRRCRRASRTWMPR